MNYLLHISLSCWLALTATAVIAAGSPDNQGAISDEPPATIPARPSVHFTVRAPAEASHQPVLIEGFWPLMQRQEQLLLLQGTWQRQHHLLSLGLGWRYFPETDWGVGYHLFYDQETTRQQRRLGLGAEVWLHSLTLTVNGYLPANGWRAARDLKGYRHCPASGYDVTLQGHLPALPHLGASLHYARYSGDAVTLGSRQQHYRNPQQWRWGIDLTPMPLLTLAYHRHATPSARAKQQISVILTYRFSLSLLKQVDPNQVATLYSALGQRLAPVQREQWIALKYAALSHDKALSSEEAASRTEQIARAEEPVRPEEPVRVKEANRLDLDRVSAQIFEHKIDKIAEETRVEIYEVFARHQAAAGLKTDKVEEERVAAARMEIARLETAIQEKSIWLELEETRQIRAKSVRLALQETKRAMAIAKLAPATQAPLYRRSRLSACSRRQSVVRRQLSRRNQLGWRSKLDRQQAKISLKNGQCPFMIGSPNWPD